MCSLPLWWRPVAFATIAGFHNWKCLCSAVLPPLVKANRIASQPPGKSSLTFGWFPHSIHQQFCSIVKLRYPTGVRRNASAIFSFFILFPTTNKIRDISWLSKKMSCYLVWISEILPRICITFSCLIPTSRFIHASLWQSKREIRTLGKWDS